MAVDRAADPFALAARGGAEVNERTGVPRHDLFVVLGSGWSKAAAELGEGTDLAMADLTGFPMPTAPGHGGVLRSIACGEARVLLAFGRVHLYEGYSPAAVVHGVRVAVAAGCRMVVLTNAAGSLRADWPVGRPVVLSDQINLTGESPLIGPNPPEGYPGRFADLTDLYSPRLRAVVGHLEPDLAQGVYLGLRGPEFETPAEIRAAAVLGADLCGMSTVLEAIAARHLGVEVLGLSLVTNLAAGLSGGRIDAGEVFDVAERAAPRLGPMLAGVIVTAAAAAR